MSSEKSAAAPAPTTSAGADGASTTNAPWIPNKPRSCVVCRSRKVRCDKRLPCSNCRRANIACIAASDDQPPRWARRLERLTAKTQEPLQQADPATSQVMDRLRSLEKLVRELGDQLERANTGSTGGAGSSAGPSPPAYPADERDQARTSPPASGATGVQQQFGRLVLQDGGRSQYVGSGFWSRVSDELDALKEDTQGLPDVESDLSDDDGDVFPRGSRTASTTLESHRAPSERNGVLFGHNLGGGAPSLAQFRPLPSQIPFLVTVFAENVNFVMQIVHMPTINRIVRDMRASPQDMDPSTEALMFAVYYAAVTSMDDAEVVASFGAAKTDLNYKFRLGLEYALAKADFIRLPDLTLVQAFVIFLCLARRHDSPRYVWMMTGLAIRMGHAVGLHRDGSHFPNLSPFEAEMRRRTWWSLCLLDVRASEDQGTEFTVANGSFDTRMPANVNDADLHPDMKEAPVERPDDTDMVFANGSFRTCQITREIMAARTPTGAPDLDEQNRLLDVFREDIRVWGFSHHIRDDGTKPYWVAITVTYLVISKLTLFVHLPTLLSSPSERFSDATRDRLLVAAIEVAEYNHALLDEPASDRWRWIIETYTHWHAIVYLLIEASRRPWSPIVERAWVALHSRWLIPAQPPKTDKSLRVWIPLRRLMARARKQRAAELQRLQGDEAAIEQLRVIDRGLPVPTSSGPFKEGDSQALFIRHWYDIVRNAAGGEGGPGAGELGAAGPQAAWGNTGSGSAPSLLGGHGSPSWPAHPASAEDYVPPANQTGSTLPAGWLGGGMAGGELTGSDFATWDQADPAIEDFGDIDIDMAMGDGVDWNAWLDSATLESKNM